MEVMTFDIDFSGFHKAVAESLEILEFGIRDAARMGAIEGAEVAKQGRFKDRTGRLRTEIVARFLARTESSATWEIFSPMPYSRFVESGTRPHDIWPKAAYGLRGPVRSGQSRRASGKGPHEHIVGRGIALRWVDGSGEHFARVVHHPGTPAFSFMGNGYLKAEAVMYREVDVAIARLKTKWA